MCKMRDLINFWPIAVVTYICWWLRYKLCTPLECDNLCGWWWWFSCVQMRSPRTNGISIQVRCAASIRFAHSFALRCARRTHYIARRERRSQRELDLWESSQLISFFFQFVFFLFFCFGRHVPNDGIRLRIGADEVCGDCGDWRMWFCKIAGTAQTGKISVRVFCQFGIMSILGIWNWVLSMVYNIYA